MNLATTPFAEGLRTGRKQAGLWVSLCSSIVAEVVSHSGFDWVLVDMEHAPNELGTVLPQLQAFEGRSATALVRPPWNDTVMVKRLLDSGARGLLFPMIQSIEEAERAVAATRYPPKGVRGVSGSTRANAYGRVTDYFERADDAITVLLQLETRAAVEQAEAIAAVDGVDGIFFGPADIAADLGLLGQPMHDDVWALIRPAAERLIERGMPVGTLMMDTAFAAQLLNDGFSFVACGADQGLLAKAADALVADINGRLT